MEGESMNKFTRTTLAAAACLVAVLGGAGQSLASTAGPVTASNRVVEQVKPGHPVSDELPCRRLWMWDHAVADEDRCRDKGWTVNRHFVLSADERRMWTGVKACVTEDSGHCYWNARYQGDGTGCSFVNLRAPFGRFAPLDKINGRWAITGDCNP